MDAAVRELLAAQEEHARALAAADAARKQLATARSEAEAARADKQQRERDLQLATATLGALHVSDDSQAAAVESYFMEFHRNIGCYQVHVRAREGTALPDAKRLRVLVTFPTVALLLLKDEGGGDDADGDVWWTAEIERNVDQASCVVSVKEDHVHLRLPVKNDDRDVASDGFAAFSQIAAAELDKSCYARLVCRACGNVLVAPSETAAATDGSQFERVLPLPSANWVDMFDFWGAGLGAFEHLPREDIFAQEARVFVGEAHLLLHDANVVPGSLTSGSAAQASGAGSGGGGEEQEDEDVKRFWEPLQCSRCAAALGMRHRENPQTIRLDKHVIASTRVAAVTPEEREAGAKADSDVFARYTVDSIVCAKLLEFADSDGVFRFTLRSADPTPPVDATAAQGETPPPPMLLQLLSWESTVKTERSPEFRRVLKVLYAPALQPDTSSSHAAAVERSLIPLPAQDLVFSPAICAAVASRLQSSSTLLPASLRSFNKMPVGYLFA